MLSEVHMAPENCSEAMCMALQWSPFPLLGWGWSIPLPWWALHISCSHSSPSQQRGECIQNPAQPNVITGKFFTIFPLCISLTFFRENNVYLNKRQRETDISHSHAFCMDECYSASWHAKTYSARASLPWFPAGWCDLYLDTVAEEPPWQASACYTLSHSISWILWRIHAEAMKHGMCSAISRHTPRTS